MKRVLYILGVLLVSLLLAGGILLAVLSSVKVDTAVVQLAMEELSRTLGTEARVGDVKYHFPSGLKMHDVYLEDQQQDTLAFVGELSAQFSPLALRRNEIRFSHVRMKDVVADVHRLPDSTWNYQFLLDSLKSEKTKKGEKKPLQSIISVKDVQWDNVRLRYEDYKALISHADMDLHQLSADTLDAEISELAMVVHRTPDTLYTAPFVVEDMKAHVILTDSLLQVPKLSAQLPQSKLK